MIEPQIQEYLTKIENIQNLLLEYINTEEEEEKYAQLIDLLDNQKILENDQQFTSILYLLSKITDNFHHTPTFFSKIEKIITYFQTSILRYFTNEQIFDIFKRNHRILLFLFSKQILQPYDSIYYYMLINGWIAYFYKEFKTSMDEKMRKKLTSQYPEILDEEKYESKRNIGENDSYICELIRNDSIDEFTSFTSQANIDLCSNIKHSIYETNFFLLKKKKVSLIEYAAFYGSVNILKYLSMNDAEYDHSLMYFAIHSNNPEMIYAVESLCKNPPKKFYHKSMKEAIRCHHNNIATYFLNNLPEDTDKSLLFFTTSLKYYNFFNLGKIPNFEKNKRSILFWLWNYNYRFLDQELYKVQDNGMNLIVFNKLFFLMQFQIFFF